MSAPANPPGGNEPPSKESNPAETLAAAPTPTVPTPQSIVSPQIPPSPSAPNPAAAPSPALSAQSQPQPTQQHSLNTIQYVQPQPANPPPPPTQMNLPPMPPPSAPSQPQHQTQPPSLHPPTHHQAQVMNPPPPPPQYYSAVPGPIHTPETYQLMNDNQLLGRHKKEVKRRTKTGCLTCRKRRIKCDERHPICRNCEKSKRDCLGYDPVFRSQPGPSAIQPAPSSQPSLRVIPQDVSSFAGTAVGTAASSTAPSGVSSASPPSNQFDYGTAVDPTLESVASSLASPQTTTTQGGYTASTSSIMSSMMGAQDLELKTVKATDLLSIRGQHSPPPEPTTVAPARLEEIKLIYMSYAMAIDRFLECHWFETKGMGHLLSNSHLLSHYSALLDGFNDRNIHEPTVLARVESREASVIWDTMTLCRLAHAKELEPSDSPADPELLYAVKRLSVFETLITGAFLETNPVATDSYPESDPSRGMSGLGGQIKGRELQFWEGLGRFLTVSGNDANAYRDRDAALSICRGLLDTFENRDVIYSIAIVRHISKYQPNALKPHTGSTDEKDAGAKLYVACRFLEDESRGKGTNQVIKRLSGMVVKYWEDPPVTV